MAFSRIMGYFCATFYLLPFRAFYLPFASCLLHASFILHTSSTAINLQNLKKKMNCSRDILPFATALRFISIKSGQPYRQDSFKDV